MNTSMTFTRIYCHLSPPRAFQIACLLLFLTGCDQPDLAATGIPASSPASPTKTSLSSPAPSSSPTFKLSPSPSQTFTPPPSETPKPATPTSIDTPISPSSTPAPNQFTAGDQIWTLVSLQKRHAMEYQGFDFTPQQFNRSPKTYQFLVFTFDCTTGASLLSLLDSEDPQLASLTKTRGFTDIYVTDKYESKYPVTIIEPCKLIATVSKWSSGFTLHFQDLPAFTPDMVARTIHRTATPAFPQ